MTGYTKMCYTDMVNLGTKTSNVLQITYSLIERPLSGSPNCEWKVMSCACFGPRPIVVDALTICVVNLTEQQFEPLFISLVMTWFGPGIEPITYAITSVCPRVIYAIIARSVSNYLHQSISFFSFASCKLFGITRMKTSISSKAFCSITDRQTDKIFTE